MSRPTGENKKKYFFSSRLCIFSIKDISKKITGSSHRFGQLKEDGEIDYLVIRMVDKLMIGSIVRHKRNF